MIDAQFSQFYVDVGNTIHPTVRNKLENMGYSQELGHNLTRYWFNLERREEVEKILGDRIIFQVRHLRPHIAELKYGDDDIGRITITMGSDAVKVNEVLRWKSIVATILSRDIKARDNDKWLLLKTMQEIGFDVYADYEAIKRMPMPETLSRIRRAYQHEGLYPASEHVQFQRKDSEKQMRKIKDWSGISDRDEDDAINKL